MASLHKIVSRKMAAVWVSKALLSMATRITMTTIATDRHMTTCQCRHLALRGERWRSNFELQSQHNRSHFELEGHVLNFKGNVLIPKDQLFKLQGHALNFKVAFWISRSRFKGQGHALNFKVAFWTSGSRFELQGHVLNFKGNLWTPKLGSTC